MTTPSQRTVALLEAEQLLCRIALPPPHVAAWDAGKLSKLAIDILAHYPRAGHLVEAADRTPELWGPPPPLPSFQVDGN